MRFYTRTHWEWTYFSSAIASQCSMSLALLTVGKHARRGELQVRKSSQMVKDGAAVTLPLGVIHKGSNVVLLAMVTNPRADYHGNVVWHANKESKWKHLTGVTSVKVNSVRVSWWFVPSWEFSWVDPGTQKRKHWLLQKSFRNLQKWLVFFKRLDEKTRR